MLYSVASLDYLCIFIASPNAMNTFLASNSMWPKETNMPNVIRAVQ